MLTSGRRGQARGHLRPMGYDARWGVLGAIHVGAFHKRERIWIVAHARYGAGGHSGRNPLERQEQRQGQDKGGALANANLSFSKGTRQPNGSNAEHTEFNSSSAWWGQDPAEAPESDVGRVANGVAARVDRLKAIGNGQVPAVVRLAWEAMTEASLYPAEAEGDMGSTRRNKEG